MRAENHYCPLIFCETSSFLRPARLSGPSLTEGIETHSVEGVSVRVYSAAKTVADCFKIRNKIGLDIAIEALKDCLSRRKPDPRAHSHHGRQRGDAR